MFLKSSQGYPTQKSLLQSERLSSQLYHKDISTTHEPDVSTWPPCCQQACPHMSAPSFLVHPRPWPGTSYHFFLSIPSSKVECSLYVASGQPRGTTCTELFPTLTQAVQTNAQLQQPLWLPSVAGKQDIISTTFMMLNMSPEPHKLWPQRRH